MTLERKDSESWVVENLYARAQIVVRGWQVFELQLANWPYRTRHFVGYEYRAMSPYVSAKIVKFDRAQAVGRDDAGGHILLTGLPGTVPPQEYASWCVSEGVSDILEVTAEVVELIAEPSWRQG